MKRATALAYAGKFTIPELQRLAIIESDPLLKKMRTETPKMMVAGMNFGQKLAEQDRPQLESELKTAIEKYYSTHGDAVSLNGAATTPRG